MEKVQRIGKELDGTGCDYEGARRLGYHGSNAMLPFTFPEGYIRCLEELTAGMPYVGSMTLHNTTQAGGPSHGWGVQPGPTMPRIVGASENVTAAEGKTAKFTCIVKNLNKYHVVWFHVERNMLLTINTKIVTRINRFRVLQDDGERWTLEIREVAQEDRGAYACQVNTEPQLRQIGYLDVVVSPEIDDSRSSPSTVVVKENENVTLICHALGNPQPNISWVREDHGPITMVHRQKVYKHDGATLELRKVSRSDMGAYLCIASNGYPPSVSKRTELFVEFSPIVIIPNQLMAAPRGTDVSLECVTEAYPRAVIYWNYHSNMVMSTHKYHIAEEHSNNYRTRVILTIRNLTSEDFGAYLCNSRNSFGENVGLVELNELTISDPREKMNGIKRKNRDDEELPEAAADEHHSELGGGTSQSQLFLDIGSGRSPNITHRGEGKPIGSFNQHDRIPMGSSEPGHATNILNVYFPDTSAGSQFWSIKAKKLLPITILATLGNFWGR